LNSIFLKFDRSEVASDSKLIIRGKQTEWLETVANHIFVNMGNSFNDWVKKKDEEPAEKRMIKSVKQGLSLNVYLKIAGKWDYLGSHHRVGTLSMRELVMDLDLKSVTSTQIEIKLESAYKLWELDYVAIANEWDKNLTITTLDFESVVDRKGNDISELINLADNRYYVQNGDGSFADLLVKPSSSETSSIVLSGTGYYHHIRDYTHERNLKFLKQVRRNLGIQNLSKTLFRFKELNLAAAE
jgi:hypothetical protein